MTMSTNESCIVMLVSEFWKIMHERRYFSRSTEISVNMLNLSVDLLKKCRDLVSQVNVLS